MKPLGRNVLIRIIKPEEKTAAGIILPEQHQEIPRIAKAIVIEVGKEATLVKPNNIVLVHQYGCEFFKKDNKELALVDERDILAIIEEK